MLALYELYRTKWGRTRYLIDCCVELAFILERLKR